MPVGERGPVTHRYSAEAVFCGNCGREIESCCGVANEWMHSGDRSERCADERYARPETENELQARRTRQTRESRVRRQRR